MFNIFGLLVALLIAEFSRGSGALVGWPSPVAAAVGIVGLSAFLYNLASSAANRLALQQLQAQAALAQNLGDAAALALAAAREREVLMRRMPVVRLGVDLLILLAYLVLSWQFGWADYVATVWHVPQHLDLLPNLLPYFGMLAGSWLAQVRLENALHGPTWRPWRFFSFQARANLMTVAPIVLINAAYWAVLTWVPMVDAVRQAFFYSEFAVMLALMVPVFLLMPLAVRAALRTRRLPDGPLRRKLEDFARRRNLKVGGLYVWETGSKHFATAFVIGLVPGLRFVFFTDALLRRFSEDEVLAVYAHELGHVKHKHLWWLLSFIVSFSLLLLATEQLSTLLGFANAPFLASVALFGYAYAVFGFISRRFERQADEFAARETSPELIAGVLLKLAQGNPAMLDKRGWRHFPIRQRVAEIALSTHRPEVRKLFDAQRRRGLVLIAAVTLGGLALLATPIKEDVVSGLATYSLAQLDNARLHKAPREKIDALAVRTLERTEAMRKLDGEYARAALQYEAVVAALAGQDSDALERLDQLARENEAKAETAAEREMWKSVRESADATEVALKKALQNNTPWDEEYRIELRRRGYTLR